MAFPVTPQGLAKLQRDAALATDEFAKFAPSARDWHDGRLHPARVLDLLDALTEANDRAARAEADNAELVGVLQTVVADPAGRLHLTTIPGAIKAVRGVLANPHPGTGALEAHREELAAAARRHETTRATMQVREEQHRKDLVRERNRAREEAATLADAASRGVRAAGPLLGGLGEAMAPAFARGFAELAEKIRATKEAE